MPRPEESGTVGARRPIIKKVKKKGQAHHGGSWKVAYADFVTAMMAFFLLLWLLSSVDQHKRQEIALYFQRPLSTIFTSGSNSGEDPVLSKNRGDTAKGIFVSGADSAGRGHDALRLARLKEKLEAEIRTNPLLRAFADQLRFELTERGLRIQVMDKRQRSMFAVGSATLRPYARGLLREIARVLNDVPNRIIISGHTDAMPYPGGEAGYSNWELSADRANAARRALVGGGIQEGKIVRVEGLSSTALLHPEAPYDPANRRISILLLNRKTERALL